ncbi:hypothetical protein KC343_g8452 [Hortaea werneckii]|nr:hypothetical protein KC317_g8739 [Hortaea werneckii]KAI7620177.1 hypothetical protein KC343_g8452 [Hortaea werneckii]KAI7663822.1 hypothetical protein KC319_g7630 [Hortaea werneckii]KAI7667065.1 hypothetical protein KC322_g16617 [Hortaea werneckii]
MGQPLEWFDSISRTLRWNTRAAEQKEWAGGAAGHGEGDGADFVDDEKEGEEGDAGEGVGRGEPEFDIDFAEEENVGGAGGSGSGNGEGTVGSFHDSGYARTNSEAGRTEKGGGFGSGRAR